MIEIILGIGVAAFIVYAGFNISSTLSMKRTSDKAREFLTNTEGNLNAALSELTSALENIRKITGNINTVAEDVRRITDTVALLEKGVHEMYGYLKEDLGPAAGSNIAGLKAGIKTGVVTLVKNLQEERSDDHEGRTRKT
ncbi:MAG TPA: DUF948 domain-containing protein [Nitrospirota bacterium]